MGERVDKKGCDRWTLQSAFQKKIYNIVKWKVIQLLNIIKGMPKKARPTNTR
jgi:hypothetical protein